MKGFTAKATQEGDFPAPRKAGEWASEEEEEEGGGRGAEPATKLLMVHNCRESPEPDRNCRLTDRQRANGR